MKRARAELFHDILVVLRSYPSLKLTHLIYKVNLNCFVLKDMLKVLEFHGYVKVSTHVCHPLSRKKPFNTVKHLSPSYYALTPSGLEFSKSIESTMKALKDLKETYERQRYIIEAKKYVEFTERKRGSKDA
jgi:predicted transcriptional regulator